MITYNVIDSHGWTNYYAYLNLDEFKKIFSQEDSMWDTLVTYALNKGRSESSYDASCASDSDPSETSIYVSEKDLITLKKEFPNEDFSGIEIDNSEVPIIDDEEFQIQVSNVNLHSILEHLIKVFQNDPVAGAEQMYKFGEDGDWSLEIEYLKQLRESIEIDFGAKAVNHLDELIKIMVGDEPTDD